MAHRSRRASGAPAPIGSVISRWIRSSRSSRSARIFQAWEDRVDPAIRARARPAELRSDTLWIEVQGSAFLHELSHFRRTELLGILGDAGVRALRFRIDPGRPGPPT